MVAALFCRSDSVYRSMGVDVFDIDRDARTFQLDQPVVAHPPCRAWSRLRHFAKPRHDEKDLARWAVHVVRHCGGVLEHPNGSLLFRELALPTPGSTARDAFGGWVLPIYQQWFGHPAQKATWLYIVGVEPYAASRIPLALGDASRTVESQCRADREKTPFELARWLVDLAGSARVR